MAPSWTSAVRVVERPPTWRGEPYAIAYVFTNRELTAQELIATCEWARVESLPNPRVISPAILRWSSLFHPRFFQAVLRDPALAAGCDEYNLNWMDEGLEGVDLSRFHLQSVLFLAGVTLSAAIVQSRYSSGTIGSKLDRLWEAGVLADTGVFRELRPLELRAAVRDLIAAGQEPIADQLLLIRRLFMSALAAMAPVEGELVSMRAAPASTTLAERFGFVRDLRAQCGPQLRAIVAYGSSVSSDDFADYDLLLVTDDAELLLNNLAGRSPTWRNKELNLGAYTPGELVLMQRYSGDNLGDYGLCIWGEAKVVHKPQNVLLARNFSFGVVRQRQQIGMLSRAVALPSVPGGDDLRNLHDYFVKIPANVTKGTFGAVGSRLSKEEVRRWLNANVGFDVTAEQARARDGQAAEALAAAVIASGRVLEQLNARLGVAVLASRQIEQRKP